MSLDEILAIIGVEGDPSRKTGKPPCFGTVKVLEVNSDKLCIDCDDWKYRCMFQFKMSDAVVGYKIDYSTSNLKVEEGSE